MIFLSPKPISAQMLEKKTFSFLVHLEFLDYRHKHMKVIDANREIY
jgi:hypothetical protein